MSTRLTLAPLPKPIILSAHPAGIGAVDIANPEKPLTLLAGPLTLRDQDRIDLYWADHPEPIATYEHPDQPETIDFAQLSVHIRWIQSSEIPAAVRYTHTPFPSGTPLDSETTHIRVKFEIPGGVDIDPATPYDNEALALPSVSPAGVISRPDGVSVTLEPYLNMSTGDVITLSWQGRELRLPPLTAQQVGTAVVISVPRDIVLGAGNAPGISVRYAIHDVVNNWSRWSLPTFVEVAING